MKKLWDRLRGITRVVAINSAWLETQDARLRRLERELEALRRETAAIIRFERDSGGAI